MKIILKILLPIILILSLLIGLAWFFLEYRPDLTASAMVSAADHAVQEEKYSWAVRFYTVAQWLLPEDPSLPISLADAYKKSGNYTKAEYTLVRAIAESPENIHLYLALERTYVEQDKLLDAVQMMDHTANEEIREQLRLMRPAAPTVTPEGGYYTEQIEIIPDAGGTPVYLTVDGTYPSLEKDLYTEPITLEPGVSTIVALTVSEDKLVSPVTTVGYTVSGLVEEITIADSGLDTAIRTALGKTASDTLMSDELWTVTDLILSDAVTDLSDLRYLSSLQSLTANYLYSLDFTVLDQLPALTKLDLSGCTISSSSLKAIAALPNLRSLTLKNCSLQDITPLSALSQLEHLDLSGNVLTDISALGSCTELRSLNLSANKISNIASLSACSNLESLNLSDCHLTGIAPLTSLTSLTDVNLSVNALTDISALAGCTQLKTADVSSNHISNIDALLQLTSLNVLDASNNEIERAEPVPEDSALQRIYLIHNLFTEVTFLQNLQQLNYVDLDYNQVSDLSPLATCWNLVQVNAFENPVSDISALKEHDIIVNYDPTYKPEEDPE